MMPTFGCLSRDLCARPRAKHRATGAQSRAQSARIAHARNGFAPSTARLSSVRPTSARLGDRFGARP